MGAHMDTLGTGFDNALSSPAPTSSLGPLGPCEDAHRSGKAVCTYSRSPCELKTKGWNLGLGLGRHLGGWGLMGMIPDVWLGPL